jgi:hypothetical protein
MDRPNVHTDASVHDAVDLVVDRQRPHYIHLTCTGGIKLHGRELSIGANQHSTIMELVSRRGNDGAIAGGRLRGSKPDPLVTFTKDAFAFVYGSEWKQRYFKKVGAFDDRSSERLGAGIHG